MTIPRFGAWGTGGIEQPSSPEMWKSMSAVRFYFFFWLGLWTWGASVPPFWMLGTWSFLDIQVEISGEQWDIWVCSSWEGAGLEIHTWESSARGRCLKSRAPLRSLRVRHMEGSYAHHCATNARVSHMTVCQEQKSKKWTLEPSVTLRGQEEEWEGATREVGRRRQYGVLETWVKKSVKGDGAIWDAHRSWSDKEYWWLSADLVTCITGGLPKSPCLGVVV